jgi:serine/threonine protein kinase
MTLPNNSKRKIFDGRYEILSIVGRGADSVVYHGRHISGAAQEVAIKVLINRDGSTTLTDKLRREALTLVSCRHRYVVRLDDFHSIKDLCYLSMEYAPQGDLLKYIATIPNKRLPPDQVVLFLKQCLEALDFVHATGVVHRDLKPENILVINEKEIRLADFGLALLPGDEVQLDELRKAVGSFEYLAPEVLEGIKYDTGSDLYSLGVCFYEAATGIHPFADVPIAEKRDARQDARITPIEKLAPDLPPHVAAVITNLMRFSAGDRFQSTSEALRALEDQQFRVVTLTSPESDESSFAHPANDDVPSKVAPNKLSEPALSPQVTQTGAATTLTDPEPYPEQTTPQQSVGNAAVASERQPTPTEKIDLERIKAIIARDTQRKTGGGLSTIEASDSVPVYDNSIDNESSSQAATNATQRSPGRRSNLPTRSSNAKSGFNGARPSLLASALSRFVGVALAFALLTVGGIYGYHALTQGPNSRGSRQEDATHVAAVNDLDQSETESLTEPEEGAARITSLHSLAEGIYPGTIRGLFPGDGVPMALIVNPKQEQLTLLVGLEGWMPATTTFSAEDTVKEATQETNAESANKATESEGPTFRSNGLILKFNQESSSASITGTVIDVVTGETGTWKISG